MTATPNGSPKPLRQANKLRAEIERTRQLRTDRSRAKQATQERIRALENERVDAYTRKARGNRNAQTDAERIEQEINDARRSIESVDAEIKGAQRAEDQATHELGQLLSQELTTFAEAAEQITQEAIAAFAAVEQPYRAASAAWTAAAREWAPLREALYTMFKLQNEQAGFYLPETDLMRASTVGPWPLPSPDELFPMARVPRPTALEPQQPDEEEE